MAVPQVLASHDRSRGWMAARYLGSRIILTRTQAVSRGTFVALRFQRDERGYSFSVHEDGNRNGVRTADIQAGLDRQVELPVRLFEQFPGVEIGVAPGLPGAAPVQVGASSLLSFSPLGTSTSGTIHVRGGDGTQWAVRVLGATGRTRVLRYDQRIRAWIEPH
jgi:hypothetical protein